MVKKTVEELEREYKEAKHAVILAKDEMYKAAKQVLVAVRNRRHKRNKLARRIGLCSVYDDPDTITWGDQMIHLYNYDGLRYPRKPSKMYPKKD